MKQKALPIPPYNGLYILEENAVSLKFVPHGWRFRRVGEFWSEGDLRVIDDWGECQLVKENELGRKVLGSKDSFNDLILTPRKRAVCKRLK
jgi:hypothetical protein